MTQIFIVLTSDVTSFVIYHLYIDSLICSMTITRLQWQMTDNEPSTMQIRMYVHVHVYNHLNFNAIQHSVIWHTLSRMQFWFTCTCIQTARTRKSTTYPMRQSRT